MSFCFQLAKRFVITLNDARNSPSIIVSCIIHIYLKRRITSGAHQLCVSSRHKRKEQKTCTQLQTKVVNRYELEFKFTRLVGMSPTYKTRAHADPKEHIGWILALLWQHRQSDTLKVICDSCHEIERTGRSRQQRVPQRKTRKMIFHSKRQLQ